TAGSLLQCTGVVAAGCRYSKPVGCCNRSKRLIDCTQASRSALTVDVLSPAHDRSTARLATSVHEPSCDRLHESDIGDPHRCHDAGISRAAGGGSTRRLSSLPRRVSSPTISIAARREGARVFTP